jgi:gluconate 5-dehydrogenase
MTPPLSIFPDQFRPDGRTVLITGSGRGLGWEMAKGLAQAGAKVLLHGRHRARLEPKVAELHVAGFAAEALAFDMADRAAMTAEVARAPAIDILINNVGERDQRSFLEIDNENFARLIDMHCRPLHPAGGCGAAQDALPRELAAGRPRPELPAGRRGSASIPAP